MESIVFDPIFLLKYASNPTAVLNNNLCYLCVSDSWEQHHNYFAENAIGKSLYDLFPNIGKDWKNLFEQSLKGQKLIKEDTVIVKNQKLSMLWTIVPWHDDNKRIGGLVISIEDITEKKLLEEKFKESNDLFKSCFDFSTMGMSIVSLEGKFLRVNKTMAQTLGYEKEEVAKLTTYDLTYPEDYLKDQQQLNELHSGKREYYTVETRHVHQTGRILNSLLGVALIKNKKGKPLYYISQVVDQSESKKAELALIKSNDSLQKIMDESLDIICNISFDSTVLQISKACETILGYHPEELIGKKLMDLILEDDMEKTVEVSKKVIGGETIRNFENRYKKKDGSIVPLIWSIRGNVGDKTIFAIIQDATEKKTGERKLEELNVQLEKRAEELSISNEYLKEFAFVASHDLQEPLRTISSFLSLIEKKYNHVIDASGKKYIEIAVDGAKRMQNMIQGLLQHATVGNQKRSFEKIDLNKIASEAISLNQYNISKKKAIISRSNLPEINCIPEIILQLIHNLINNALKYQKEGVRPLINITCEEQKNCYKFSFSDNGIGIDKQFSEKIFTLFQRLHGKSSFGGSGIGLSICKRIVETHRGKIWVESELGVGSTFYFTIHKELG